MKARSERSQTTTNENKIVSHRSVIGRLMLDVATSQKLEVKLGRLRYPLSKTRSCSKPPVSFWRAFLKRISATKARDTEKGKPEPEL